MARRWYVNGSGAAVSWPAAVVGGVAVAAIFEVVEFDTRVPPAIRLWAAQGQPVSAQQVAAAQAATSTDPIPAQRPPEAPVAGASSGGGGIAAFSASRTYGAGELVVHSDRIFRAKVTSTGSTPVLTGAADAAWAEVSSAAAADLSGKQDAATAATDAELASGLAGKQDAATAATDAELASGLAGKKRSWQFSHTGVLSVKTGAHRIYNRTGATISLGDVHASVGTAPTGSAATVALAKGGVAVTGATASIAAAANAASVAGPFAWENGTYLTVDITAVGSTVAGSDLVVTLTEA